MATLTVQHPKRVANELVMAAADEEGDEYSNTGNEMLLIENGSASPITLTVPTPYTVDGLDVDDREITIPAGESHLLGPFPQAYYNDTNGKVQLEYSAHADVSVAVIGL